MRILYLDIDALRPDHLGCYGYHRSTSPNIDRIAARATRFERVYCSDSPCMPSRTALFSGRFGARTGAVAHGGTVADPFIEGHERGFESTWGKTSWMRALRDAGYHTAAISSFGDRHSAWWYYANFSELQNPGGDGMEQAHEVTPHALEWLDRQGAKDNWFLHLNFWDVHAPYRTPEAYGNPFADASGPAWLTQEIIDEHWQGTGFQSARERSGYRSDYFAGQYPRQPAVIDTPSAAKALHDGYDTAIRYVDDHIGLLLDKLEAIGVLEDTAIILSADHGENLGELNIYGCHQTADPITTRVPLIFSWPGLTGPGNAAPASDAALRYHFDFAATVVELAGGAVPDNWDGRSFAPRLKGKQDSARDQLVLSHAQGTCQRAVRWADFHYIRSWHDGYRQWPEERLFDVVADPHLLYDLASSQPEALLHAREQLQRWDSEVIDPERGDPIETVMAEGGPPHLRGQLGPYLEFLRESDRNKAADAIAWRHAADLAP